MQYTETKQISALLMIIVSVVVIILGVMAMPEVSFGASGCLQMISTPAPGTCNASFSWSQNNACSSLGATQAGCGVNTGDFSAPKTYYACIPSGSCPAIQTCTGSGPTAPDAQFDASNKCGAYTCPAGYTAQTYFYAPSGGPPYTVNGQVFCVMTPYQCSNAKDDDGDGLTDMNDPGCTAWNDNDETNAAPAVISVTPSTPQVFPNTTLGSTNIIQFQISNTGSSPLVGSVTGLSAPFSCTSGACGGYTINPGDPATTITIQFAPTAATGGAKTYTGTVTLGGGGGKSIGISGTGVAAPPPPPSVDSFTVNGGSSATITSGGNANLAWSVSGGPANCTLTNGSTNWNFTSPVTGSMTRNPTSNVTYTLSCNNSGGSSSKQVTVTVNPACTWQQVDYCPSSGVCVNQYQGSNFPDCSVIGASCPVGGQFQGCNSTPQDLQLYCLCSGNPLPPPAPRFQTYTANGSSGPLTITQGTNVTIAWTMDTVTGGAPTSCTASGAWSGSQSLTGGSVSVGAPSAAGSPYTYTLTCTNTTGSASKSVTVNVNAPAGISVSNPSSGTLDFGNVSLPTSGIPQTITITNSGGSDFTGAVSVSGTDYSCTNNCDFSSSPLAPTASRDITITFNPTSDNGGSPSTGIVTFTGVSSPPTVSLTGQPYYPVNVSSFSGPTGSNPEQVISGGTLNLTWGTVTGTGVTCTGSSSNGDAAWDTGTKSTSGGSQTVGPITGFTTYTLDCTSPYDTSGKHPQVNVDVLTPVFSLSASPQQVLKGKSTNIVWDAQYYASCDLSEGGSTVSSYPASCYDAACLSGLYSTPGINATTTYVLACHSAVGGGDATSSLIIYPFVPVYTPF